MNIFDIFTYVIAVAACVFFAIDNLKELIVDKQNTKEANGVLAIIICVIVTIVATILAVIAAP